MLVITRRKHHKKIHGVKSVTKNFEIYYSNLKINILVMKCIYS